MLLDCKELEHSDPGRPCFNWRTGGLAGASPIQSDALRECWAPQKEPGAHAPQPPLLRTPGNGTLSAVLTCVHLFGSRLRERQRATRAVGLPGATAVDPRNLSVSLFVMGDAPGFGSLVSSLPAFHGRVVNTNDAGAVAHTTFTTSCSEARGGGCLPAQTNNPRGGWTRAMIDFYVGGLSDGFVSALFSSCANPLPPRVPLP